MKVSRLNKQQAKKSAQRFFEQQQNFKEVQAKFEDDKAKFYSDMEGYFGAEKIDSAVFESDEFADGNLQVTKVQSSTVKFNPDKLEKAIGKELSKSVITKQYQIIDIDGLITYLRSCGVDPKVFKSFLSITKSVNTKELDRLEEIGEISAADVKGTYSVKQNKPYFKCSMKRGKDGDEEW